MFSLIYIGELAGTFLFGAGIVVIHRYAGRFYGRTLSSWVNKTRNKEDELSAEKLMNVRKRLEILAHDLLKHRLLGLDTLTREMRLYFNEKNPKNITPEQLDDMRNEFFRLCGIQNPNDDRLWHRLINSFKDMMQFCGRTTALPHFDPMFAPIISVVIDLRKMLWGYVDNKDNEDIKQNLSKVDLTKCTETYPTVLKLAEACQMVIKPEKIIQKAINTLESQIDRANIREHIHILAMPEDRFLCQAPSKTLVMCMTRLMDNALEQGTDIALDISFYENDFTGESSLIFKIYDQSDHIPTVAEYGMGMRGVKQSLNTFDGGIQYRLETRDIYKKATVVSLTASRYLECPVSKRTWKSLILSVTLYIITVSGFLLCLINALGGPPVEFAGKGNSIIEFSVNAGEQLNVPLCQGGRNVHAIIENANNACFDDNCSFIQVLNGLAPCNKSLEDPQCPGAIIWTPGFEDGLRIGKNYEVTIHCISDGPPTSEDFQKIRILVQRPNSPPVPKLVQIINETQGETHYLNNSQNKVRSVKVDATDRLQLRVLAVDDDSDPIIYYLKQPDGSTISSNDGTFSLAPKWSQFGTSTYELTISDNIIESKPIPIILEADHLHPIELKNLAVWTSQNATNTPCEGNSESRVCHIYSQQSSELSMYLWFDPILPNVHPYLQFHAPDGMNIGVRSTSESSETKIGDQWEIYSIPTNTIVGFVELTNIQSTNTSGLYHYIFNILPATSFPGSVNLPLNLEVTERSNRMPELKTFIVFVYQSYAFDELTFSTHSLQLTEFDRDEDITQSRAGIWLYPQNSDTSRQSLTIDDIVCQTPAFSEYFEKPSIHNLHHAWRVDFKLKKGCIKGLNADLSSKQRLCAANIHFDDDSKKDDVIWIMLQDRQCSPYFDELNLTSSRNDLASNLFKWNFKIIDPDGDLKQSSIQLVNADQYIHEMDLNPVDNTTYTGELTIQTDCLASGGMNSKLVLQATDNTQNIIQKSLSLSPNCPPLVTTADSQLYYKVSEGDSLYVPLKYEDDVTLTLNSPFGKITHDAFIWEASCRYGKGPHTIEISANSGKRYGRPLQFDVELTYCKPRFTLYLDNLPLQTGTPAMITVGQPHSLTIQSSETTEALTFTPQFRETIPNITITEQSDFSHYQIDLECTDSDVSSELIIKIQSNDDIDAEISPILIPIECIAPI